MFGRLPRTTSAIKFPANRYTTRPLSFTATRWKNYEPTPAASELPETQDVPQQLLGSREEIERKRKAAEAKYAEKIKQRMAEYVCAFVQPNTC
jgi:hypothetical protein